MVIASTQSIKNVAAVCKNLPFIEKIFVIDGETIKGSKVMSLRDLIANYSKTNFNVFEFVKNPVKLHEQSAVVFLSSGTTGTPKGEMNFNF